MKHKRTLTQLFKLRDRNLKIKLIDSRKRREKLKMLIIPNMINLKNNRNSLDILNGLQDKKKNLLKMKNVRNKMKKENNVKKDANNNKLVKKLKKNKKRKKRRKKQKLLNSKLRLNFVNLLSLIVETLSLLLIKLKSKKLKLLILKLNLNQMNGKRIKSQ